MSLEQAKRVRKGLRGMVMGGGGSTPMGHQRAPNAQKKKVGTDPLDHYPLPRGCPTQSMAFKHNTFQPDPLVRPVGPKIAHFKGLRELAWADMGQIWLK